MWKEKLSAFKNKLFLPAVSALLIWPKRSYILLLFLRFTNDSFHAYVCEYFVIGTDVRVGLKGPVQSREKRAIFSRIKRAIQ